MGQRTYVPRHRRNTGRSFNGRAGIDSMYDKKWEAYRSRFLAINYECYACGQKATVVDHLVPHKGDDRLFKKLDNHIPLCIPCHNTVTSKFDRNYKVGNPVTTKIKWLSRNRISTETWQPKRVKVLRSYED